MKRTRRAGEMPRAAIDALKRLVAPRAPGPPSLSDACDSAKSVAFFAGDLRETTLLLAEVRGEYIECPRPRSQDILLDALIDAAEKDTETLVREAPGLLRARAVRGGTAAALA